MKKFRFSVSVILSLKSIQFYRLNSHYFYYMRLPEGVRFLVFSWSVESANKDCVLCKKL